MKNSLRDIFLGSFTIQRDMISGQMKGCALGIQVRYTRLLWHPRWAHGCDGAVDIRIAAPKHDPVKGYRCVTWGVRFFRNRRRRLSAKRA